MRIFFIFLIFLCFFCILSSSKKENQSNKYKKDAKLNKSKKDSTQGYKNPNLKYSEDEREKVSAFDKIKNLKKATENLSSKTSSTSEKTSSTESITNLSKSEKKRLISRESNELKNLERNRTKKLIENSLKLLEKINNTNIIHEKKLFTLKNKPYNKKHFTAAELKRMKSDINTKKLTKKMNENEEKMIIESINNKDKYYLFPLLNNLTLLSDQIDNEESNNNDMSFLVFGHKQVFHSSLLSNGFLSQFKQQINTQTNLNFHTIPLEEIDHQTLYNHMNWLEPIQRASLLDSLDNQNELKWSKYSLESLGFPHLGIEKPSHIIFLIGDEIFTEFPDYHPFEIRLEIESIVSRIKLIDPTIEITLVSLFLSNYLMETMFNINYLYNNDDIKLYNNIKQNFDDYANNYNQYQDNEKILHFIDIIYEKKMFIEWTNIFYEISREYDLSFLPLGQNLISQFNYNKIFEEYNKLDKKNQLNFNIYTLSPSLLPHINKELTSISHQFLTYLLCLYYNLKIPLELLDSINKFNKEKEELFNNIINIKYNLYHNQQYTTYKHEL